MKFIQQAYKGDQKLWKYLIPILGFFSLILLNYWVMDYLGIDTEQMLKEKIEENGANTVLFQNLIVFAFLLFGLFLWVKFVHKQSITALTTSRNKIDWSRIFFAFGLWGGITLLLFFIGYHFFPDEIIWNFNPQKFLILLFISATLIPFQIGFEEYFFRGYLLQGIGIMTKNCLVPLILTSVIFGLLHLGNPEVQKLGPIIMVYYIGTGLLLGIITLMDEGLELALGFHAANNLVTVLLVTADWTVFQTDSLFIDTSEPSVGWELLFPVFVLFPIVILIFSKKYGWSNWKDKLLGKVYKPIELNEDEFIA